MAFYFFALAAQEERRAAGRRYRQELAGRSQEVPNAAAAATRAKDDRDRLLAEELEAWDKVATSGASDGIPDFVNEACEAKRKALEEEGVLAA